LLLDGFVKSNFASLRHPLFVKPSVGRGLVSYRLLLHPLGPQTLAKSRARVHVQPGGRGLFLNDRGFFITEEDLNLLLVVADQDHIVKANFFL